MADFDCLIFNTSLFIITSASFMWFQRPLWVFLSLTEGDQQFCPRVYIHTNIHTYILLSSTLVVSPSSLGPSGLGAWGSQAWEPEGLRPKVVPGICWSQIGGYSSQCPHHYWHHCCLHTPHFFWLLPWYFKSFSCSFFLMLPSLGMTTSTTTAVLWCWSTTTMSGWLTNTSLPVLSHRIFPRSSSFTFGGISHLGPPVHARHRCSCVLCL